MLKNLIKLALALVVLHGAFRVGYAYWTFYRFEDALQEIAQFGDRKTEVDLCQGAVQKAADLGVPIPADALFVRKGGALPYNCKNGPTAPESGAVAAASQLLIYGAYTEQLQVLPGYTYPWTFALDVKVWSRL
jgi:hypothetical protein